MKVLKIVFDQYGNMTDMTNMTTLKKFFFSVQQQTFELLLTKPDLINFLSF